MRKDYEASDAVLLMMANMMRMMAGGGHSFQFQRDLFECVDTYKEHWDEYKMWPDNNVVSSEVQIKNIYNLDRNNQIELSDIEYEILEIVRASLRLMAAKITGHASSKASSYYQLIEAAERISMLRAKLRAQ